MGKDKYICWLTLISLCLVLLYGCHPDRQLAGNYWSNKSPYFFSLNRDSTFDYRCKFQFVYQISHGTWHKVAKNKVVLNSSIKDRTLSLNAKELSSDKNDPKNLFYVSINIPDTEKKYYQCMVFVNDNFYEKSNCDSFNSVLVGFPINNIQFKISADPRMPGRLFDTLSTKKFSPQSSTSNKKELEILFSDSLFNYRIFDSDTITLTKKGIRFIDAGVGGPQLIDKARN
jgi:hypothetical protein